MSSSSSTRASGGPSAGDGGVVVVEGPAGIGKSRLLAEARRRADGSVRVLSARGSQLEGEFAFGVVRQLFETRYATPELLTGAAAPAAAVFGQLDGGEGASFAALHGLYWLVLNLAEQGPLLLAVDDLHWCDRPSLLFFAYLARRLEGQPILLLAGLREAEPGTDPALLGELAHDPAAARVRPGPLSEAAVATVIEERLGAPPAAALRGRLPRGDGRQPAAAEPARDRARRRGRAPGRRARRPRPGDRPAGGLAHGAAAARAPAARGASGRAGGRGARRRRRPARRGRARRGRGGAGRRGHARARAGRDPARRAAAGLLAPARARRRLPRAVGERARAPARAGGGPAARERRPARARRGAAAAHLAARRALGRRAALGRGAGGDAGGSGGQRRRLPAARARTSTRSAASCCSSSARPRC